MNFDDFVWIYNEYGSDTWRDSLNFHQKKPWGYFRGSILFNGEFFTIGIEAEVENGNQCFIFKGSWFCDERKISSNALPFNALEIEKEFYKLQDQLDSLPYKTLIDIVKKEAPMWLQHF
jgi:hypothetical protein